MIFLDKIREHRIDCENRIDDVKRLLTRIAIKRFVGLETSFMLNEYKNDYAEGVISEENKIEVVDKYINKESKFILVMKFKDKISESLIGYYQNKSTLEKDVDRDTYYDTKIGDIFSSEKIVFSIKVSCEILTCCVLVYMDAYLLGRVELSNMQILEYVLDSELVSSDDKRSLKLLLTNSEIKKGRLNINPNYFEKHEIIKTYEKSKMLWGL